MSTMMTTIGHLAHDFSDLMKVPGLGQREHRCGPQAEGFTIGRGKKIYWYICTSIRTGTYYAVSIDGARRYGLPSDTIVTVHYPTTQHK